VESCRKTRKGRVESVRRRRDFRTRDEERHCDIEKGKKRDLGRQDAEPARLKRSTGFNHDEAEVGNDGSEDMIHPGVNDGERHNPHQSKLDRF